MSPGTPPSPSPTPPGAGGLIAPYAEELSPGSILCGRYQIGAVLGVGGFGTVYRAVQLATRRDVAIKVMHDHGGDVRARERRRARFRQEMALCARLHHPNVVALIDAGETDDGRPYAAFAYVPGETLAQVLAVEGALSAVETRHLMLQVLDALACAHRLGIIHRDVKPANIMVVSTGSRRNALLLDFGVGTLDDHRRPADLARITSPQDLLGTPTFCAPEQLRGEPPTPAADLYSWALVALECLTGEPAIAATTMPTILMHHLGPDPVALPAALRRHPLGDLLARALVKDVAARSANAAEVAAALDACEVADLDLAAVARARAARGSGPLEPATAVEPGTSLADPAAVRLVEGERRPITVTCVSIAPARGSELEDVDAMMPDVHRLAAEIAERHGGRALAGLGHQVMIKLGYPVARERDARHAVQAAVELRAALEALDEARGPGRRVTVRAAVHAGLVTFGPAEEERRRAGHVIGLVPVIASQLNGRAPPGAIVVSSAVARAVDEDFALEPCGSESVAGITGPLELFLVGAARAARRVSTTLDGSAPVPVFGRERELDLILGRWREVVGGRGQTLLVTGEPGIGKSRLVAEVARRMPAAAWWVDGRCAEEERPQALQPFAEVLDRLLAIGDGPPAARLARLEAALATAGVRGADTVALLAPVLGVPVPAHRELDLSEAIRRGRTVEAMVAVVLACAAERPLVLCLEDVHWGDQATLDLLAALGQAAGGARVLVLLTARRHFAPPWPAGSVLQVPLGHLGRPQVLELIAALTSGRPLPAEVVELVVERTDGVPLFVEELTRMVIESGAVTLREGRYELTGTLTDVTVPTTLRASLMARLDRLGRAKTTAQLASALGRELTVPLLAAVSGAPAAEVEADLAVLVAAGVLQRERHRRRPTWSFRHSLIRDTAHDSMIRRDQQRLHARIAEVLEQQFPDVARARPDLLARHHAAADQKERAIACARDAADAALAEGSYVLALRHARAALGWIDAVADPRARGEAELALLAVITRALMATRGWRDDELLAAVARSQALGDHLGQTPFTGPTMLAMVLHAHVGGERERTRTLAQRMIDHARRVGDPAEELSALDALAHARYVDGDFAGAVAMFEQVLAASPGVLPPTHARAYGHDPRVWSGATYAEALWFLGHPARSVALADEVLGRAAQLGHATSHAIALVFRIVVAYHRGERHAIDGLWQRVRELSSRHGLPLLVAYAGVVRSWAVGDVDGARHHLAVLEANRSELGLSLYRSIVAEAEREAGDAAGARSRVAACRRRAEELGERYYLAALLRLEGSLVLAADPSATAAAETRFRRGIELARHQGTRLLELRCATELARVAAARGDLAAARELLAARLEAFAGAPDERPIADARALLAGL